MKKFIETSPITRLFQDFLKILNSPTFESVKCNFSHFIDTAVLLSRRKKWPWFSCLGTKMVVCLGMNVYKTLVYQLQLWKIKVELEY